MNWMYTPYTLLALFAALISIGVAFVAWQKRSISGASPLIALILAVAWWSGLYALELASTQLRMMVLLAQLEYIAIVSVPVFWLLFVLSYTGRTVRLSRWHVTGLFVLPAITLILVFTNGMHHLIWKEMHLDEHDVFIALAVDYGGWFWVHTAYSYGLMLISTVIMLAFLWRSRALYRGQAAILVGGALMPWIGNVVYLADWVPVHHLDLTPLTFAFSGWLMAWGVFRFRLFEIVPVARRVLVDSMDDAMLALDMQGRIVDMNVSAEALVQRPLADVVGHGLGDVMPQHRTLMARYRDLEQVHDELELRVDGEPRYYDLQMSPLYDHHHTLSGRLIVLRDITERKALETSLEIEIQRNIEVSEAQRRMADRQVTLYEVLRSLQRLRKPEQVVNVAVNSIARLTDWSLVALLTFDTDPAMLRVEGSAGPLELPTDWRISASEGIFGRVKQALRSAYVLNSDDEILPQLPDVHSLLVVPLLQERKLQRFLCIAMNNGQALDADARFLAESMAEIILLVLRDAQLNVVLQNELVERQRAEDRLWSTLNKTDALYRVSRALIGSYDLAETLHTVVNGVVAALEAEHVFLVTLNSNQQRLTDMISVGPGLDACNFIDFDDVMESLFGWVIRRGMPLIYPDGELHVDNEKLVSRTCVEMDVGSAVIVPLIFHETAPYGALAAMNGPEGRQFSRQDLELIVAIGAQVAVTIRNVRLFQRVVEEQSRLQALVRSSSDGVVLIGMDLRILVMNQPAITYLGMVGLPEDWINRPLWDALSTLRDYAPEVVRVMAREMRRVKRGDEPSGEGEYQVKTRMLRWLNLPVVSEEEVWGRLIILRDITEVRMVEKMREDLTHTMVHDLRNPLTGINGSLQLLGRLKSQMPDTYQELLSVAQSSTDRMLSLVTAILDISRLESGRMPLNQTVFSLQDTVNEVLMLEQTLAEQRKISLIADLSDNLPLVWADPELITRVLQNLVGNALKFTPASGEVRIQAWVSSEDPGSVQITVRDTGSGIPPELQSRLFEKFVTGRQEGKGSGLGLAFCKMVLEAHNERIWVSSVVGEGTTFTFTLALASRMM